MEERPLPHFPKRIENARETAVAVLKQYALRVRPNPIQQVFGS